MNFDEFKSYMKGFEIDKNTHVYDMREFDKIPNPYLPIIPSRTKCFKPSVTIRLLLEKILIDHMRFNYIISNIMNKTVCMYDVIWWNKPLIIMAIRKIIESDMNGIPYDSIPMLRVLDIHPWDETLIIFKRNYTKDLKI